MNRGILDILDDKEAMLLLYHADELTSAERLRVEHMLAGDPELSARLDALTNSLDAIDDRISAADSASALPGAAGASARQFGRAVNQWHADQVANANRAAQPKQLRFPWWSYPLATAAAATVAVVVWWKTLPPPGPQTPEAIAQFPTNDDIDQAVIEELAQYAGASSLESMDDASSGLTELELELGAVESLREAWQ